MSDEPSYESPCGVMSAKKRGRQSTEEKLRIPMRGYEVSFLPITTPQYVLRIPMRGYESFKLFEC